MRRLYATSKPPPISCPDREKRSDDDPRWGRAARGHLSPRRDRALSCPALPLTLQQKLTAATRRYRLLRRARLCGHLSGYSRTLRLRRRGILSADLGSAGWLRCSGVGGGTDLVGWKRRHHGPVVSRRHAVSPGPDSSTSPESRLSGVCCR